MRSFSMDFCVSYFCYTVVHGGFEIHKEKAKNMIGTIKKFFSQGVGLIHLFTHSYKLASLTGKRVTALYIAVK